MLRHLYATGTVVRWPAEVVAVDRQGVVLADGRVLACDLAVNATGLLPNPLAAALGLPIAADGGLLVDDCLRSAADPTIFAVGDGATILGRKLARIGVHAVREAPILLHNLVATLNGRAPEPYRPQRYCLAIIGLGDRTALMTRGRWWLKGPPALWLKHWIDRRFVDRYRPGPWPGGSG